MLPVGSFFFAVLDVRPPGMTHLATRSTADVAALPPSAAGTYRPAGGDAAADQALGARPVGGRGVTLAGLSGTARRPRRAIAAGASRAADYALKTLRPPWDDDPRAIAMLRREAAVGRTVSHPHLISILASSTAAPPYYVVMPWLTGTTLARLLESGMRNAESGEGIAERGKRNAERSEATPPLSAFRFPLSSVFWIARQVAEALGALGPLVGRTAT